MTEARKSRRATAKAESTRPRAKRRPRRPVLALVETKTELQDARGARGASRAHGSPLDHELHELAWAHEHLEEPSFAARLSNAIGTPIERGLKLLPLSWQARIQRLAEASARRALDVALVSLGEADRAPPSDRAHKVAATVTGAVGGFFGPLALAAELPVTTVLMLRSIAEIAQSEGEDLANLEGRLACVEVFGLGGRSHDDDAADTGYYGLRIALGLHFFGAIEQAAGRAVVPMGVNMLRAVSSRFGVVISDKVAAQMTPFVGAAAGALVNLAFMQHFQDVARGHFIVRRLERKYGSEAIHAAYDRISLEKQLARREYSRLEGW